MQKQVIIRSIQDYREFLALYESCKEEVFYFRGSAVLKQFAKYLIEYMEKHTSYARALKAEIN